MPVYLLTYDHGGYILWGNDFRGRITEAVEWLEKYPSFKIGLDNESFAYDHYAGTEPEAIRDIQKYLQKYKGRFGIGSCTYGQPLSVFINEESNVRQLTCAIKTNLKYFGTTPPVYAVSEHALHGQIPQLIAKCGYKGAIMRTHFMMYGYNPVYDEPIGYWEGCDGTRVPTVPTYEGQGASFAITTYDNWILTRWPDQTNRSLENFTEKFKHIEPLLASRIDDLILRCEKLVAHTEGNGDYQWILLEELPEIYPKPKTVFKPSPNEFVVRMPWGYCGNYIWNRCRESEIAAGTAERANALACICGGRDDYANIETAWKHLLAAQHHDVQICGMLGEAKAFTEKTLTYAKNSLSGSMAYLSGLFHRPEGYYICVFNPLSWKNDGYVALELDLKKGLDGIIVKDGGAAIPCAVETLDTRRGKISRVRVTFKASVPALAVKCFSLAESPAESTNGFPGKKRIVNDGKEITVTNGAFELKLDEYGIRALKHDGKKYVSSDKGRLFAGIIEGCESVSKGNWSAYENGGNMELAYNGLIGGIPFRFTLLMRETSPRLDCACSFYHNGECIGETQEFGPDGFAANTNGFVHENKLCFCLETVFMNGTGIRDLPFIVSETQEKYIQGNYWAAVSDGAAGLAVFNRGAMCLVYENTVLRIPLAYANDYIWGNRYLYGEYTHEFSLMPFDGGWKEADIHRKALEYQYPMQAYSFNDGTGGVVEDIIQPIKVICDDNIIISALFTENNNLFARFYDYKGEEGKIRLEGCTLRHETDLLGLPVASEGPDGFIKKHEIKTYLLNAIK